MLKKIGSLAARYSTAIKICIAVCLLVWFIVHSDMRKILGAFHSLSFRTCLFVIVIDMAAITVSAMKWNLLLPRYSLAVLINLGMIGRFYSLVLPGQIAGEVVKSFRLAQGKKNGSQIALSVIVDRITGTIGIFIVGVAGLFLSNKRIPWFVPVIVLLLIFFGVCVLFSIMIPFLYRAVMNIINAAAKKHSLIRKNIRQLVTFIEAWRTYGKRWEIIIFNILLGVVFQCLGICMVMLFASDFGIVLSCFDWCLVLSGVTIVLLLPITIGGIGVREASIVGFLAWFGVQNEYALALSFAIFGLQILDAAAGGIIDVVIHGARIKLAEKGR
ncbi:MAG: lysylphosphatidylglycerol synthase transmembrane domain-containing protein [Spirochaetota bacterium]